MHYVDFPVGECTLFSLCDISAHRVSKMNPIMKSEEMLLIRSFEMKTYGPISSMYFSGEEAKQNKQANTNNNEQIQER